MVNFVIDAVAGARRTLCLSVALNVLGLRFIRDGLCCASRRCGVISCALSRQPYFSSMSLQRLRPAELRIPVMPSCCAAAAINFSSVVVASFVPAVAATAISDCEDVAAPHVPAVAAAAVYDCRDVAASLMPSVAAAASHASARHLVLHFVTGLMVGGQPSRVGPAYRCDSLLRGQWAFRCIQTGPIMFVLGLRIVVSEALRRHSGQLLRQRQYETFQTLRRPCGQLLRQRHPVLSRLYASLASRRLHRRVSTGFFGDHVTFMFPYTALSLVRLWIHAHASGYEGSGIFPFFQFQYVSGCRHHSTTAACTQLNL